MKPTTKPRVKICCIASIEEAWMAIERGVGDRFGVGDAEWSGSDSGRSDRRDRRDSSTGREFVFTNVQGRRCLDHRSAATTASQHDSDCDRLPAGSHQELREALPGVSLVQVVHVTGPESVDEAIAVAPHVDAILLDRAINRCRSRNWVERAEHTIGV